MRPARPASPTSSSMGAVQDYQALLKLGLGRYPEAGQPIDPSPAGPLGQL